MPLSQRQIHLMGTIITLSLEHPSAEAILEHTEEMLNDFNHRYSANKDHSKLMEICNKSGKEAVKVEEDLYKLIQIGKEYSISSDRKLNIAIGPLIKLWRIGFQDAQVPSQHEIDSVLKLIDPSNIQLNEEEHTVYLTKKGMEIDLGALAKGYFADIIKEYWLAKGVTSGLINLGGNVLTVGKSTKRADGYWQIGIQHPKSKRGEIVAAVPVKDKSVVTSGIYERTLTVDGQTFHHIFDSQTGYPIETDVASISIVAIESLQCEIWTTILFAYDAQEALQIINQLPDIEGIIITRDDQMFISNNLVKSIRLA